MKCYNLDEIKTRLNNSIIEHEALKEAWEAVTFPTKKDGSPFANMQKNIDGARYKPIEYAMQRAHEYDLTVTTWSKAGYKSDTINCYELVKYLKDDYMKAKTENYMPKEQWLEQVYKYDIEDIKNAIQTRILYHRGRIESLKKQLEIVESAYMEFRAGFEQIMNELERDTHTNDPGFSMGKNDIYYMIKDTILDRFPYC